MKQIIIRSLLCAIILALLRYAAQGVFPTEEYITRLGGLALFTSLFGTLYGVMTAFIVFEAWNQYKKLKLLIDQEALGLEKLYRLSLYFRDPR